jgi:hypothetical protein
MSRERFKKKRKKEKKHPDLRTALPMSGCFISGGLGRRFICFNVRAPRRLAASPLTRPGPTPPGDRHAPRACGDDGLQRRRRSARRVLAPPRGRRACTAYCHHGSHTMTGVQTVTDYQGDYQGQAASTTTSERNPRPSVPRLDTLEARKAKMAGKDIRWANFISRCYRAPGGDVGFYRYSYVKY